jgi:hypothetical protein
MQAGACGDDGDALGGAAGESRPAMAPPLSLQAAQKILARIAADFLHGCATTRRVAKPRRDFLPVEIDPASRAAGYRKRVLLGSSYRCRARVRLHATTTAMRLASAQPCARRDARQLMSCNGNVAVTARR